MTPQYLMKKGLLSQEGLELYLSSDVIDLHTDSFIWPRVMGYRVEQAHRALPWGNVFFNQVDLPRLAAAGLTGVSWDIPTNPLQTSARRFGVLRQNISTIIETLRKDPRYAFVKSYSDYIQARDKGKIASFISIQGGQAIDANLHYLERIPEVHRITLLHFTRSKIGSSSFFPWEQHLGLSRFGHDFVEKMIEQKILIDLAHINRKGFFDVVNTVQARVPIAVTHTGLRGCCDIWRNLDDAQIKAIAKTNGTIGVIYERRFLAKERHLQTMDRIVEQMAYLIRLVGEDYVSLGSDYDGLITLPDDFPDITYQPILVQKMLDRGWSHERVRKILGGNFLRVLRVLEQG